MHLFPACLWKDSLKLLQTLKCISIDFWRIQSAESQPRLDVKWACSRLPSVIRGTSSFKHNLLKHKVRRWSVKCQKCLGSLSSSWYIPPLLSLAPTTRRLGGLMGLGISVPNSSPSMRNRLCYASLHSPSPLSPHFLCPAFFTIIHPCWNCKLQAVENTFSTSFS